FTQYSHEFQTITDSGEDATYINRKKGIAINEEILNDDTLLTLGTTREELERVQTVEVGNIFNFGRSKCEELGVFFRDEHEQKIPVWLGSYGLGITRLMGVLVEKGADEKGIVWPASVAPFMVHLVALNTENSEMCDYADGIYEALGKRGVEVLYDDRMLRPGEKFADSDLIGLPYRVVVSEKTREQSVFEVVERKTGKITYHSEEDLYNSFSSPAGEEAQ
ncbi:MAG: His/Gly/Thr/Pro-type tRNA ligase C-terminal domain-containing protein, partial [Patescibacteria group bacterium]|nr:His/Gly/Thr/Pro-type tRNA ligase C-terminal domain-containing protein [Patescibacteria group bacterium]